MWGGQDEAEALDAIDAAIDAGITTIDTAPMYGFGRSEEIVGKAIRGKRNKLQILTKYCLSWEETTGEFQFTSVDEDGRPVSIYKNGRPESIIRECEQSLTRLGIDCIDLYQCHWRDTTTPVEETMSAIDTLIKQGKVRASGVSNFTAEEMAACNAVVPLASDQPPFSMVHREIEADVLPYCRENNIGVIVYSPLQRGLLTGKIKPGHVFPEGDHRAEAVEFRPGNVETVNAFLAEIRPIAEAHNATLAQLAIAWTIGRPGITAALVGARNRKQALENAGAADVTLSAEDVTQIDSLLDDLHLDL